jgi:hypothetical protein
MRIDNLREANWILETFFRDLGKKLDAKSFQGKNGDVYVFRVWVSEEGSEPVEEIYHVYEDGNVRRQ